MNGSGIQPTVELATTNGNGYGYPYPVYPMFAGNGNNGDGFFGGEGIWAIVLLALLFNGGFGGFGGYGMGGFGGMYEFPWLLTGQQGINNNVSSGFRDSQISDSITSVRDGIASLSTQLCGCCGDIQNSLCNGFAGVNSNVSNGFANAEIANNSRQIANMQQAFNSQISTLQGFNNLGSRFDDCCCENRLGLANLNATILSENCADRAALADGLKDVLINQTANTQRILDQLCNDKIDAKNEKIADLQREILMKDLQASQVAQTAQLRAGQETANTELLNLLNTCPIPSTPVYGRTPIFTCNNNGCGCSGNTLYGTSQFI